MSTETTDGHAEAASQSHKPIRQQDSSASANWSQFFHDNGWVEGDKIHCPDELIFELRFSDGHSLVVYPASNLGEGHEAAPSIVHGVLTFKNGTDHFYYPWSMLASVLTKLNPRRARKVQGREYAVDSGADYERKFKNAADLILEPTVPEGPKTMAGTVHTPTEVGPDGKPKRQFSAVDPNAPSWSAGGTETKE